MQATIVKPRLSATSSAWNRFWFTPADPTVLGAIRILTGLITFYTLFVYSFDLQELIGEHAWLDLQLRQEQYRQGPVGKMPLGWMDTNYALPSPGEQKKYHDRYMARWKVPPPLPYPKTEAEEKAIDDYRDTWGIDPRQLLTKGRTVWSVWFHITDPFAMAVVHGAIVLCSFLFMIGYGTRITSVLTWFGALCYMHRAPGSLFGVDTMMTVLLLYLMIGSSGAALSVDRLLACWKARRAGLPPPPLMPSVSANLAIRLIQIHTCIIYGAAGMAKLQGQTWWTGIAPWGTLANFEFAPMQYSIYVEFLRWLAETRWLFEIAMTLSTIGTLVFEVGYPFLIWRPSLRAIWLWMAVLLHVGIGMFMGLRTFSLIMLGFNLAFVSPETVRWALRKMSPKRWQQEETPPPPEPERPSPTAIARHDKIVKATATTHVKRRH